MDCQHFGSYLRTFPRTAANIWMQNCTVRSSGRALRVTPFLLLSKTVQHEFGNDRGCSCTLCTSNRAAGIVSSWPLITQLKSWTLVVSNYCLSLSPSLAAAPCTRLTQSGNEMFGTSITQWVFQERGVLKVAAAPTVPRLLCTCC